jgi:hypothetical protein
LNFPRDFGHVSVNGRFCPNAKGTGYISIWPEEALSWEILAPIGYRGKRRKRVTPYEAETPL